MDGDVEDNQLVDMCSMRTDVPLIDIEIRNHILMVIKSGWCSTMLSLILSVSGLIGRKCERRQKVRPSNTWKPLIYRILIGTRQNTLC